MRRLFRPPLGRKARVWLGLRTREVLAADDPKKKATDLWRSTTRHRYKKQILATLLRMTSGVGRCMYCEDSAGNALDHRWPKSRYPERAFCWENLFVVCTRCNGHKLAQFPLDERGEPLLINPTAEDPAAHIVLSPRQGRLLVKDGSRKGEVTLVVLKLNRDELVRGRTSTWVGLQILLLRYFDLRAAGRHEPANRCRDAVRDLPFSALLHFLLRVLELPSPEPYLEEPDRLGALQSLAAEIHGWLEPP